MPRCSKIHSCNAAQLSQAGPKANLPHQNARSDDAIDHHMFDRGNGLGGVQPLGTGIGAVHDRVAAIKLERILKLVQPLARGLIARIDNPAIGGQQRRRLDDRRSVAASPHADPDSGDLRAWPIVESRGRQHPRRGPGRRKSASSSAVGPQCALAEISLGQRSPGWWSCACRLGWSSWHCSFRRCRGPTRG